MRIYCRLMLTCWMLIIIFSANQNNLYGKSQKKKEISISSDTIFTVTNKITPKHLILESPSNFLYIIPPDESFKVAMEIGKYGIFSEKLNSSMRFSYQAPNEYAPVEKDFISMILKDNNLLMNKLVKSTNNVLIRYAKSKKDTTITWQMVCGNDFFGLTANLTYNVKYDKMLTNNVENMFKSIIVERNPDITPTTNSPFIIGDYEVLGLNLVKRMSIPISYFTVDGIPFHRSKGTRAVMLSSISYSNSGGYKSMEQASIESLETLIKTIFLNTNDKIIPYSVKEVDEINEVPTLRIEGHLLSDDSKNVVAYCSSVGKFVHIICGIYDEKESNEFFKVIDKFKETVTFR